MSLAKQSVPIVTNSSGVASATVRGAMVIRCVDLELGTLSTPDISITDEPTGTVMLSVTGVATDKRYIPAILGTDSSGANVAGAALPFPVATRLQIDVTGGGDTKTGRLVLLYER
jgi:hypothetical protein